MQRSRLIKGYIFALASAGIYGCMPLMAKLIYAEGINSLTLVFLRNSLCIPIFAAMAYSTHHSLAVPKKLLPQIALLAALGCGFAPLLLFISYVYIDSGTATVLNFVYPAAVVLAELIFLKRKVPAANLISVAICVAGISLFYTPGQALDLRGAFPALLSGIVFAAYVVMLGEFKKHDMPGLLLSFYISIFSSLVLLAVCLVSGQMTLPGTLKVWVFCTLFSFAISCGAMFLFQQATIIIGGARASVLSTIEPVITLVIGVTLLNESISPMSILGAALVIGAGVLIAVSGLKREK